MSYDFYCQIISEYTSKVDKLVKLECDLEEAKKQRNKDEKERIQKAIGSIYEVFCKKHPALFYQLLEEVECDADAFRSYWIKEKLKDMPDKDFGEKIKGLKSLIIPKINANYLSPLPKYSFAIQINFTLAKPYISKDDKEFYIIDNPVKKDWVFKVPLVSSSTWKGHLRWTTRKNEGLIDNLLEDNEQIIRLFGHQREKEEGEEQRRGRLMFFPTFLDKIDMEIINPHDRETKAGKNPIPIESVPQGANGTFTLLYIPFDLIGKPEKEVRKQIKEDLKLTVSAVKKMMTVYGFSAKKTSGFGVIEEKIQVQFSFNIGFPVIEKEAKQSEGISAPVNHLPKYLISDGKLKPEFLNPDETFREVESRDREKWNKEKQQMYDKAKRFYEKQLTQDKKDEVKEEDKLPAMQPKQYPIEQLADIEVMAQKMAEALEGENESER